MAGKMPSPVPSSSHRKTFHLPRPLYPSEVCRKQMPSSLPNRPREAARGLPMPRRRSCFPRSGSLSTSNPGRPWPMVSSFARYGPSSTAPCRCRRCTAGAFATELCSSTRSWWKGCLSWSGGMGNCQRSRRPKGSLAVQADAYTACLGSVNRGNILVAREGEGPPSVAAVVSWGQSDWYTASWAFYKGRQTIGGGDPFERCHSI
ncbi:hypothetical protein VTK73DRAFT_2457 [Phialemonium thermophilum]|uniref:Uncharacterized protein n=1 Tax=Phialemonium thermophilum TaxID=223376 RepID=A0ABR3VS29_9PEZI